MTHLWNSLQFKIPAVFIVSFFLILISVVAVFSTIGKRMLDKQAYEQVILSGQNIVSELGNRVALAESLALALANIGEQLPKQEGITADMVRHALDYEGTESFIAGGGIWPAPYQFQANVERRSFFWGRDATGKLQYYEDYNDPEGPGYHHEEWYVPAKHLSNDEVFWSKSYMDPYSFQPMVTVTAPMYRNDQFYGVTTVDLKLEGLRAFLSEISKTYGGYAFAMDRNGKFLSFPDEQLTKTYGVNDQGMQTEEFIHLEELADKITAFSPMANAVRDMNDARMDEAKMLSEQEDELAEIIDQDSYQIDAKESQLISSILAIMRDEQSSNEKRYMQLFLEQDSILGEPAFGAIFEMPGTYWKVVTVMPYSKAVAASGFIYRNLITTLIAVMLISLFVMLFLVRRFLVKPLKQMSDQLEVLNEVSGPQHLEISDKGELGGLARLFNRRSLELHKVQEELRKSQHELEQRVLERTEALQNEVEKTQQMQSQNTVRSNRVSEQQSAIISLSLHEALSQGRLIDSAMIINEAAAQVAGVERSSIWISNQAEQCFEAIDLYERSTDQHSNGYQLKFSDYPAYFNALEHDRSIAVKDIFDDSRTSDLKLYAESTGVGALLDSPIRIRGDLKGVICFEHVGGTREWHIDEIRFSGEIADQYLQVLANHERLKSEAKVRQLAFYDPLTELANRRLLQETLHHELEGSSRRGTFGSLLYFDLDNFKTLNDALGHHIGDELLVQLSQRLRKAVRSEDMASRLGGDEFVVLIPGEYNAREEAVEQAIQVANKIQTLISKPYNLHAYEHVITSSIGIALYPENHNSATDILKQADTAMYQAKEDGKNTIRFYNPAMQLEADHRLMMEKELREAIALEQFEMYYQPQLDANKRVVGCEALIRWIHPDKGMISPVDFIPVSERTGLILEIGKWVLADACAFSNGLSIDHVSVNISPVQFRQPDFVQTVSEILDTHCNNPSSIMLELTEGILIENIEDTVQKMNALKELGLRMSIDDFGTGYSSLAYLKQLPLDELKINDKFVRDITIDSNDAVIVETIIAMAKHLGLHVVAEGVETKEQLAFLTDHSCELFQGYYYSRPVPKDEFLSFIKKH
jgi:diguanylate cyclase (GGDEF)-like protein